MINGHINAGTLFKESHRASIDPVDQFDSEAMHCLSYAFGVQQMVNHQLVKLNSMRAVSHRIDTLVNHGSKLCNMVDGIFAIPHSTREIIKPTHIITIANRVRIVLFIESTPWMILSPQKEWQWAGLGWADCLRTPCIGSN